MNDSYTTILVIGAILLLLAIYVMSLENKRLERALAESTHRAHLSEKRCAALDAQLIYWIKKSDELMRAGCDDDPHPDDNQFSEPQEEEDSI